jgi:hypothetical protein
MHDGIVLRKSPQSTTMPGISGFCVHITCKSPPYGIDLDCLHPIMRLLITDQEA